MIFWLDAQLSPEIAGYISDKFGKECHHVFEWGVRRIPDKEIYSRLREPGMVLITKDSDFVDLQYVYGEPPKVLWLRVGNTSNARLKQILDHSFKTACTLLEMEPLIEITD